jgi:transcriptional regulator with XRE-family HTH domain
MQLKNNLPGNLLILRESADLKQADIQNKLGIVRNTWSNWENGKTEPDIDNLLKIARFFNMEVGRMITENLANEDGLVVTIREPEPDVKESDQEYPLRPCMDCEVKERIIQVQQETINALQGQVDVLQLYLSEGRSPESKK